MDVNRSAPVIVTEAVTIFATPAVVWHLLSDIDGWTTWQPDITASALDGPLAVGTTFRWATGGLQITSTIGEVDTGRCIAWSGVSQGIEGVHVWTVEPTDPNATATSVSTVESWDGEPVRRDPAALRAALENSLRSWLGHLRAAAEGFMAIG
jgi:hypothetical protein